MSGEMRPPFWLQSIKAALVEAQSIPMWEGTFPFSFEDFSHTLSTALGVEGLRVAASKAEWIDETAFMESMGDKPFVQSLHVSPIEGKVAVIIPHDDVMTLAEWTLTEKKEKEGLLDENIKQGFFTFSLLLLLDAFSQTTPHPLTPRLSTTHLPQENSYALDITIKKGRKSVFLRLLLPASFQQAANTFLAQQEPPLSELALENDIPLFPTLTCGAVSLTSGAWKKVKKGDFIILDHASYTPGSGKGTFQLRLGSTPLFQVKVKDDEIKILDYPIEFQEIPMDNDIQDELPPEDEYQEPTGLPPLEEDLPTDTPSQPPEETLIDPNAVPLTLTVELGQISMSLKKLLALKPGNVLETGVHPDKPVRLTLQGKPVAEGQLTQVGDCIGIQITRTSKT